MVETTIEFQWQAGGRVKDINGTGQRVERDRVGCLLDLESQQSADVEGVFAQFA